MIWPFLDGQVWFRHIEGKAKSSVCAKTSLPVSKDTVKILNKTPLVNIGKLKSLKIKIYSHENRKFSRNCLGP